jgi:hypothetical protein
MNIKQTTIKITLPIYPIENPLALTSSCFSFDAISGRKAFQKPFNEGIQMLNAIQDVYLTNEITIA